MSKEGEEGWGDCWVWEGRGVIVMVVEVEVVFVEALVWWRWRAEVLLIVNVRAAPW
jgi:hypothetical protein